MSVVLNSVGLEVGGGTVGQMVGSAGVDGGVMLGEEVAENDIDPLMGTSDWDAFSRSVAVTISEGI